MATESEILDNLCGVLLGEKVPVRFVTRDKSEVLIHPDAKLTKRDLGMLAHLWASGKKFEVEIMPEASAGSAAWCRMLLGKLEPEYDWESHRN